MSISGSRLSAPLNLQEVYNVLGVNKSGTFYDVGYICGNGHGKINKWSRHKPIRVNQPGELTDAQFKSANFGLQLPSRHAQDYAAAIADSKYTYLPPRPGTDWCRLTDFINYSHIATSPVIDCEDVTLDKTYIGNDYTFNLNLNHYGHDDYNIGMDEIPGLSSMYLACILKSGDSILWKTADKTLGEMGTSVTFENVSSSWTRGSYYMCAASRIQSGISGTISNVDFYGLPFNTAGGASAEFTVTQTNPLTVTLMGGANSYAASTYIDAADVYPGGLAYFIDGTAGFWLQSKVVAKRRAYTINISNLRGEIQPAWTYGSSTDYTKSTTGSVPMNLARYENGKWVLYQGGSVSFSVGVEYQIRIGRADWAWYLNGTKQSSLAAQRTAETAHVITTDLGSRYSIGSHSGCRMIGPT